MVSLHGHPPGVSGPTKAEALPPHVRRPRGDFHNLSVPGCAGRWQCTEIWTALGDRRGQGLPIGQKGGYGAATKKGSEKGALNLKMLIPSYSTKGL